LVVGVSGSVAARERRAGKNTMWMNVIGMGIGIGRHGESRVEGGRSGGVGVKVMTPASGATYYLGKRDERAHE
jgi:hypothetical protein